MFRVIPAVDLKDGKCVQLQQGKEDAVLVSLENPVEVAEMWVKKGARVLHVIDLSGAFGGRLRHEDIILEIRRRVKAEIQVGGGIRDTSVIKGLISAGIDRVIIGTMAVEKIEEVKTLASKYPGRIMVAIDSRKDKVVVRGWKEETAFTPVELARLYEDCDVSLLYTNVDVEGLMRGAAIEKVREVVEGTSLPVYVAGGITTRKDVEKIKKVGAAGVVIGSALYTGKVSLEELLELEED
ncbi:1-(5-phosphoribosyl)-5-[(5-phosphoribosylamino)methylideneamino]imidazole-4-carboxamide isomerase [Archaeoglobus veneficus]|uniref:1-(5-phosphoribosyl)-5-[(5-phosphoribosylamino)methylideneamino] imidazole-4-carboxamide isomerase n=1 Tax=Archaeoglobus veneficus (strain DSM 11195 / SNP6) TaxID=693661 RepID=F2KQX6_ARCVS|nr:1-(5-phosphoribosyl)-5-[(5-phosphoribosylamino)methylideneamino]imidazole-4-carboxamide isomerase [Archaeoglobus veneficus]AEA47782.1 1-(5-phosphoribosyl)-5-((5- phosphoribosylamino)methylideneamino) imidazole-4-carboxamide isomerase [Archaeoglobus veneficus SNP6]